MVVQELCESWITNRTPLELETNTNKSRGFKPPSPSFSTLHSDYTDSNMIRLTRVP